MDEKVFTPHLGIFWLSTDFTQVLYKDRYPENIDMASLGKTGSSHESYWYENVMTQKVVNPAVKVIPSDFKAFARGRVALGFEEHPRTGKQTKVFHIYLGEFLTGNTKLIQLIKDTFGLNKQYVKVIPDNQYN